MSMKLREGGFSVVEAFIIVCIIAALGLCGWFYWQKIHKKDDSSTATTQNQTGKTDAKSEEKVTVPNNYTRYDAADVGFAFAYPKAMGALAAADTGGNASYLLYQATPSMIDAFAPHTQSPLYVSATTLDAPVESAAKYGPMLEYRDGKWLVSAKNGGDVNNAGYVIGSEYTAKTAKTITSTPVYDFSYTDEGCYTARWAFVTSKAMIHITLPSVCADEVNTIPQDRLGTYKKEARQVLDTIQIL